MLNQTGVTTSSGSFSTVSVESRPELRSDFALQPNSTAPTPAVLSIADRRFGRESHGRSDDPEIPSRRDREWHNCRCRQCRAGVAPAGTLMIGADSTWPVPRLAIVSCLVPKFRHADRSTIAPRGNRSASRRKAVMRYRRLLPGTRVPVRPFASFCRR